LKERTVRGAKSYKLGLEEVDDSLEFHFGDEGAQEDSQMESEDEDADVKQGTANNDGDDNDYNVDTQEEADKIDVHTTTNDKSFTNNNNPDLMPVANQDFDKTCAIFLISFGEEAASSTLVERCVLSLRRRGQYNGYIVVLTDAPSERYMHVWDENVIVMHPQKEHLVNEDGTPLRYSKDNMSLKPKRFKTFVLDYIELDRRLDDVKLLYYLDIDILAGDSLDGLFRGLEKQYQISINQRAANNEQDTTTMMSKLYFVTPLSKEWPLQSGTMIAQRDTSRHCLKLWRNEIEKIIQAGDSTMDQDALKNIYRRIESGEETQCQLIRMENEHYISFPTPRNFAELSASGAKHAHLIHISNSVFAKRIDEEEQNSYIHQILQLSDEEIESGMYGKAIVRAKDSSR
jgi:hypothetical protein